MDRVAGSPADLEARIWLRGRMEAAGLVARADSINNVFGRQPGGSAPWLLVGSHTDTVLAGGRLDGAFGVMAALEACRALLRDPHVDELGGYLEIHIEQGPVLESEGRELGVVEGIVGIRRLNVRMEGEANHAGTTPYAARRDAGAAAAKLAWQVRDILHGVDPTMVGNAGVIGFEPGSPNVVPGGATLVVEVRSLSEQSVERACEAVHAAAKAAADDFRCRAMVEPGLVIEPVHMDPRFIETLVSVCERNGRPWRMMSSGAGHDAGALAARLPAGMLFVPSRGGISHSPLEHTDDRLLVQGAQALLNAIVEMTDPLVFDPTRN